MTSVSHVVGAVAEHPAANAKVPVRPMPPEIGQSPPIKWHSGYAVELTLGGNEGPTRSTVTSQNELQFPQSCPSKARARMVSVRWWTASAEGTSTENDEPDTFAPDTRSPSLAPPLISHSNSTWRVPPSASLAVATNFGPRGRRGSLSISGLMYGWPGLTAQVLF